MKFSTQKLRETLGDSNLIDLEKELIQESFRIFLLGEDRENGKIISFLNEYGILTPSKENDFDVKNLSNKKIETSWDRNGLSGNSSFFGTQKDWNQTFITRINQAASDAGFYEKNLVLLMHDRVFMEIFEFDCEYLKKEMDGFKERFMIGSRYVIETNNNLKPDEVLVCKLKDGELHEDYAQIKIKNF